MTAPRRERAADVYLYLNCEGWVRFGPFRWVRFCDDRQVITDEADRVIARRDGNHWTTPDSHPGYRWQDPFVTTASRHPTPNHG